VFCKEAAVNESIIYPEVGKESAASFAQKNFGGANLGHKTRNAALVRTATRICRHPGGTLPHKMASPAAYKSMDNLMNRPEVNHASVLASHQQCTREKMAAHPGPLLIVHDTTELDYSGLSIPELGQIGNGGGRGYECHNSLVVDPNNREAIGLINQILHVRAKVDPKEGTKAKRERKNRESRLWSIAVKGLERVPAGKRWLDVCDRGADIFEFLATEKKLGRSCVVRARHDRTIKASHDGTGPNQKLFAYLRSLDALGTKSKRVFDEAEKADRQVTLSVSAAPVLLLVPRVRQGEYEDKPIQAWGVRVWEESPPAGVQALEWFLVTYEVVETVTQALEICSYYECRFVVEEYHKAKKTGCHIEHLQFETAEALQPMIGLLSVVAIMLLNLRQAARRPDAGTRKATEVVDKEYEEILRVWRYRKPKEEMSVKEFYLALGRLGGHMNRKSDGMPGWLVLWRGWEKLQSMVDGAAAERRRQKIVG
jgi:hypothetical protein